MIKFSKYVSLSIVIIIYTIAFFAGLLGFRLTIEPTQNLLLSFFVADVVATVIVWLFGLIFKNASMYDPYWSVAPIVLFLSFVLVNVAGTAPLHTSIILYLIVFVFWGVRLTLNWIIDWPGMCHQDWRYTMLKQQNPKLWIITNFFGINMMPTLIVFAGMLPAYFCTLYESSVNTLTFLGVLICLLAVILQISSDSQMRRFRKDTSNHGKNMQAGLWKYSRHPNYLGEVSFWWGIWIIQINMLSNMWWIVFAPILMTLLFVFISIPMMEKRLLTSKTDYEAYQKSTSMLLLLPKRMQHSTDSNRQDNMNF